MHREQIKAARHHAQRIGVQLVALSPRGLGPGRHDISVVKANWYVVRVAWVRFLAQFPEASAVAYLRTHLGIGIAYALDQLGAGRDEIESALQAYDVDAELDHILSLPAIAVAAS